MTRNQIEAIKEIINYMAPWDIMKRYLYKANLAVRLNHVVCNTLRYVNSNYLKSILQKILCIQN